MEARLTRNSRLDQIDAERFRDMIESEMFRMFLERIHAELGRAAATTENGESMLAVRRAQGAAAALRVVGALPRNMLAEMKANAKTR